MKKRPPEVIRSSGVLNQRQTNSVAGIFTYKELELEQFVAQLGHPFGVLEPMATIERLESLPRVQFGRTVPSQQRFRRVRHGWRT